jgi:sialate O-acetylesterase
MDETYRQIDLKELEKASAANEGRVKKYEEALKVDKGLSEKWYDPAFMPVGWKTMDLPKPWGNTELAQDDGIVWFRREIILPKGVTDQQGLLGLGPIDDRDDAYVNGVQVGSTNSYVKDRQYNLNPGILNEGKNVVVIRVTDSGGGGGFNGRSPQLFLEVAGVRHPLDGEWHYKSSVLTTDFGIKEVGPNSFPSQLYNAMIAPLTKFTISGVIWYQGESNVGAPQKYQQLFPSLIQDWRRKWGNDFPFLWVQLANFQKSSDQPQESNWAALREAQTMTLKLPSTGQALAIDIGEAGDIHPRNKQDVGLRLALAALKVAYGKDVVYSGPVYNSVKKEGSALRISFDHVGGGLVSKGDKYGYLKGFAVAGADGKFVWAKAHIEGGDVLVSSPAVSDPISVRYAWADNPDDANLFNAEGLPACPFRSDVLR